MDTITANALKDKEMEGQIEVKQTHLCGQKRILNGICTCVQMQIVT